jgi:hypothetical protein
LRQRHGRFSARTSKAEDITMVKQRQSSQVKLLVIKFSCQLSAVSHLLAGFTNQMSREPEKPIKAPRGALLSWICTVSGYFSADSRCFLLRADC